MSRAEYVRHRIYGNIGRVQVRYQSGDVEVLDAVRTRAMPGDYAITWDGPSYWFAENLEPSTEDAYRAQLTEVQRRVEGKR